MKLLILGASCVALLVGCDFLEGMIHGGGGELPPPEAPPNNTLHQLGEAAGGLLMDSPYGILFGAILGALGLKGKQAHTERKRVKQAGA